MKYGSPEYGKAWRDKHKVRLAEERKEKYETFWKVRRARRMHWINKYKVMKGCQTCGYSLHPVALDFDHVDPATKRFNISHRTDRATLKSLVAEIRRCVILCANCHRIKTLKEKQFDPFLRKT